MRAPVPWLHARGVGTDSNPVPNLCSCSQVNDHARAPPPTSPRRRPWTPLQPSGRGARGAAAEPALPNYSRVAHVDPRDDLVAGLAREAVAAAAVREQVVEILHREVKWAGHGDGGGALHAGAGWSEGRSRVSGAGLPKGEPPSSAPEAGPPGAGSLGRRAAERCGVQRTRATVSPERVPGRDVVSPESLVLALGKAAEAQALS